MTESVIELKVLRPDAVLVAERSALVAAPRGPLSGARLTVIENGKPRARELLGGIAARLVEEFGLRSYEIFSKPSASKVISESEAAAIAASSDVVLTGLGDCSCSSLTHTTASDASERRKPALVPVTRGWVDNEFDTQRRRGLPAFGRTEWTFEPA